MRRILRAALLALALAAGTLSTARAGEPVDLLLVLAADVSRSVDVQKFQLQRDGYAAAFSDARVLEAIRSGTHRRIAVCFVEWSGLTAQRVVIDWTVIHDAASAREFGDKLVEAPRSFAERTSISGGIDFAVAQFARSRYEASRRTIDVSGDGTNNSGRDVRAARDEAVARDITINGLVILSERPLAWNPDHTHPPGGLANYYQDNVIGGPGAFVMAAEDFNAFGKALINKLVAEIAQSAPPRHVMVADHFD
ncbi:MAG TPA: DUF1194 domain-containing protein [Xanthobacteraceae bacterium]|nr:DUF1194 domain-containing protein [Xanthobacteraceae bacterium]